MFENLSLPHLLVVFAVVILLFGPKRIPEIAGSMGKGIREFKKHISEATRPESPGESSTLPRSAIDGGVIGTSNEVPATSVPGSKERGAPYRLLG
jgi:sec-independent protein translocase protein TatA